MNVMMLVAIQILFRLIRYLPVRLAGGLGAGLGRVGYLLDERHRRVALRNLERIFPEKGVAWKKRIARESFAELGRVMFEMPHIFLRSKSFLRSRVQIDGERAFREAMQEGRGVFLAACHHSNWEMGALMFSLLGYKSTIIYKPLRQAPLEKYLKCCRERFGACMRSRLDGLRWMPKALKNGASIAVMIDQHQSNGVPIPFLGHLASTTTLPAVFSFKYGTPVFGVALHRIGKGFHFRLQFWPIPAPEISGDKNAYYDHLMHDITQSFDPVIRARPELWLWAHRRWRTLEHEITALNGGGK